MPTEIGVTPPEGGSLTIISEENPFPIKLMGAVTLSSAGVGDSGYVGVPGIVTGAAYADGDAIGAGAIVFPNCVRNEMHAGQLYSATYLDLDKEGLQVDLYLYAAPPTYTPTDNGAYAPADADHVNSRFLGVVSFVAFSATSTSSVASGSFSPIGGSGFPGTSIYGHAVARGALNIAIGNLPLFRLYWLAD